MRILFDLISSQPVANRGVVFHGGGEFTRRVFIELVIVNSSADIEAVYNQKNTLDEYVLELCQQKGIVLHPVGSRKDFARLLGEKHYDKFFMGMYEPEYDCEIPRDTQVLLYKHDTRSKDRIFQRYVWHYEPTCLRRLFARTLLPMYAVIRNMVRHYKDIKFTKMLLRADRVFTVSNFSRYELVQWYKLSLDKVTVFYPPLKQLNIQDEIKKDYSIPDKKFFLLVSCNRYVKNAYMAVHAFDELFDEFSLDEYCVVCCGKLPPTIYADIKHKDRFILRGYLEEQELDALYKNAHAFIYPTLFEGFGYPPLEAMRHGTPVLASAVTAVTEVCGQAVLYFNPYSLPEIKNRILFAAFENLDVYRQLGLERYNEIKEKQAKDLSELVGTILT